MSDKLEPYWDGKLVHLMLRHGPGWLPATLCGRVLPRDVRTGAGADGVPTCLECVAATDDSPLYVGLRDGSV